MIIIENFSWAEDSTLTFRLVVKVAEMKPEYFPPREDIILQNEASNDIYIVVSGEVVSKQFSSPNVFHLQFWF